MEWILFLIFVALNVADVISTLLILKTGGRELNIFMRFCMDRLGRLPGLAAPKIAAIAAALIAIYLVGRGPVLYVLLAFSCAGYGFIVVRNLSVLSDLKKKGV